MTERVQPEDHPPATAAGGCGAPDAAPVGEVTGARFLRADLVLFAIVILLELVLFRTYCQREILSGYPRNHDQVSNFIVSYILHAGAAEGGLPRLIAEIRRTADPKGPLLAIQAALIMAFLGASRWSALLVNFSHFLLLQATLLWAVCRVFPSGRAWAALAWGLLLAAATPFFFAGGLADFRHDFAAMCVYGCFLSTAIAAGGLRDRRGSALAALFAVWLVLVRTLAVVYLAGFVALLLALLVVRLWRHGRAADRDRLFNVLGIGAAFTVTGVAWIALKFRALSDYYVAGHVTGVERQIRIAESGLATWKDHVLWYPRSLVDDHLGSTFVALAALLLALALAARFFARRSTAPVRGDAAGGAPLKARNDGSIQVWLAAIALAAPLAILTVNQVKSPVVAGILVVPVLWLVLLAARGLGLDVERLGTPPLRALVVGIVLVVGFGNQVMSLGFRSQGAAALADGRAVVAMYRRAGEHCQQAGLRTPGIAYVRGEDYMSGQLFQIICYEATGQILTVNLVLGATIFDVTAEQVRAGLDRADIVVLPLDPTAPLLHKGYPFDQRMRALDPVVRAEVQADFHLLDRYHIRGQEVGLFVRPTAVISGGTADGWLLETFDVAVPSEFAVPGNVVALAGEAVMPGLEGLGATFVVLDDRLDRAVGQPVAARCSLESNRYSILLEIPRDVPSRALRLHVSFDRAVAPADLGSSPDARRLVVRTPERNRVIRLQETTRDPILLGLTTDGWWTDLPRAVPVRLPPAHVDELPVWIEAALPSWVTGGEELPVHVAVEGAGVEAMVRVPPGEGRASAPMPWPDGRAAGEVVWLRFEPGRARAPADLDRQSADRRKLALQVVGVGLGP